jgi:5-methylcytosine-specific restriction protein A
MGWENSTRRSELPPDWQARRKRVAMRAGWRCEWRDGDRRCVRAGNQCDHIIPGGNHALENLQWLCPFHHQAKTQAEARAARVSLKRKPEQHPGQKGHGGAPPPTPDRKT